MGERLVVGGSLYEVVDAPVTDWSGVIVGRNQTYGLYTRHDGMYMRRHFWLITPEGVLIRHPALDCIHGLMPPKPRQLVWLDHARQYAPQMFGVRQGHVFAPIELLHPVTNDTESI